MNGLIILITKLLMTLIANGQDKKFYLEVEGLLLIDRARDKNPRALRSEYHSKITVFSNLI